MIMWAQPGGLRRAWIAAGAALFVLGLSPRASAQAPTGTRTSAGAQAPEAPVTVDLGLQLGLLHRFGDAPSFEITERTGLTLGGSVNVTPSRHFTLGIAYEHADLGHERSALGPYGSFDVERDLSALWATARVHVLSMEPVRIALALGPGLVWQSADASGTLPTGVDPFAQEPFSCEGSDSMDLALSAGAGVELRISGALYFTADASLRWYRLTDRALDACVPGAGTIAGLGARAGFAYRLDVTDLVR